jgi:hypothetical protein
MSTNINSENYNGLPALYSNAGKLHNCGFQIKVDFTEEATSTNKFQFIGTAIYKQNGNWNTSGLVQGDTIIISLNSLITPTGLQSYTRTVTYINGNILYIDSALPAPFTNLTYPTDGEVAAMVIKSLKLPQAIEFQFNLTKNGVQSVNSLIDGEVNRFIAENTHTMTVGEVRSMVQLGNKSGGMLTGPTITRLVDTTASIYSFSNFLISFSFYNWLIFNNSNVFNGAGYAAPYIIAKSYPLIGNPNGIQSGTNGLQQANTGYFDENYNGGVNNFSIVSPIEFTDLLNNSIDQLSYNAPSKFKVIVSNPFLGTTSRYRLGMAFKPVTDSLYKNKLTSASNNLMLLSVDTDIAPSTTPSATVYTGNTNSSGAGFALTDLMFKHVGSNVEITGKITPNANTTTYFDALSDGERQIAVWVQMSNPANAGSVSSKEVNLLVYEDDCYSAPLIATQLDELKNIQLLDHDGNQATPTVTEDDILFKADLLLVKGTVYDGIKMAISSRNNTDSFELESIFTSFANIPFVNGIYEIDSTTNRNFSLPPSTDRNFVKIYRKPSLDTLTKYGFSIEYSFLNDWRYWIAQSNVDNAFFDTAEPLNGKNRNWQRFQDSSWSLNVDTYLREQGADFYYHYPYINIPYNADDNVVSHLFTLNSSNGATVSNLLQNELVNVSCRFTVDPLIAPDDTWAEFTIEDFESGNRFVASSVLPRGNVQNNPFVDEFVQIIYGAPDQIIIRQKIDTTLVNASKVSITARIYAKYNAVPGGGDQILINYRAKINYNLISLPQPIEPEDRGLIECCCAYDVVADLTSTDSWKNDVKGVYIKLSDDSDTHSFVIKKCGEVKPNLGTIVTFPNDDLTKGFIYNWKQYLQTYGIGVYTIEVNYTISGVTGSYTIGAFDLQHYSLERLNETVRIKSIFNSYSMEENIDFTGSNFTDTVRVGGYFGLMKPNADINNLIDKGRKMVKTTREFVKSYELLAEPLTSCESPLILKHLLNEDGCYISDYNISNHSYLYNDYPVILSGEISCEYPSNARIMRLKATFNDMKKINKSLYNVI